jgi:hypothetical protein
VCGGVAKRSKAADCKSAGVCLRRFEPCPPHHVFFADLAQQAEHFHGKEGVAGSIPAVGSIFKGKGPGFLKSSGSFLC